MASLALAALISALLFAGLQPKPAGAVGCANASRAGGNLSLTELRTAMSCLINTERQATGRSRLTRNTKLQRAAGFHTREMQRMGFMTHNSINGQSAPSRIHNRFGYGKGWHSWGAGEILAECWGAGCTPQRILALWLRSPTHDRILHRYSWMHFGIGVRHGTAEQPSRGSGLLYTVDFGYRH